MIRDDTTGEDSALESASPSSKLTESLLDIGLVDKLRIMVNPVVLGDGKSLFRTAKGRISLRLLKTRPFGSGNVLLVYQPDGR